MINKTTAYNIFRLLWCFFLLTNIADLNLRGQVNLIPFLHGSEIQFIKYIPFAAAALIIIPLKEFIKLFKDKEFNLKILPLVLLLIVCFISSSYADFPGTGFLTTRRYAFYFFILIAVAASLNYFEDAGTFLIRSFIYANVLVIIGSLLEFYIPEFHRLLVNYFERPEARHSIMTIGGVKIIRPMGFLTDSNLTAFSVGTAMLLMLVNHNNFNKYFRWGFYIAGSYVFGMLTSRASIIMCLFTIVILIIFKMTERKEVYIFIICFIIFQAITPQTYSRFIIQIDEEKIENEVGRGRPLIWKAAYGLFKDNPVIGAGPGSFFEVSKTRMLNIIDEENPGKNIVQKDSLYNRIDKVNPHSIFLVMLSETGAIGFVLFLAMIFIWLYYLIRKKLWISLVFIANFLFVSSFSNFAPYYRFYLVMCIIFFAAANKNFKIPQKSIPTA